MSRSRAISKKADSPLSIISGESAGGLGTEVKQSLNQLFSASDK